jgi:uncharacterized protein
MSLDGMTVAEIVTRMGLAPHPEGGFYRETFRDSAEHEGRAHSTAIYYLLGRGDRSAWHRVDAVEIWHHYAGAPLAMRLSEDGKTVEAVRLGKDMRGGERHQVVVPRHWWQTAESMGDWTLAGCTVAPGFVFSGFEMAPPGFDPA